MKQNLKIQLASIAFAVAASAFAASAAEAGPVPETHDGLFLRLSPGFSAAAAVNKTGNEDVSLSGGAGFFGFEIGVAVSPNMTVGADLASNVVLGPTLSIGDLEFDTDDDLEWGVLYFGGAINYYLPSNIYLKGGIGGIRMTLRVPGDEESRSEMGFGVNLGVGKEWWVSPNWGVGAALGMMLGSVPDGDDSLESWGVATIGASLSATYN